MLLSAIKWEEAFHMEDYLEVVEEWVDELVWHFKMLIYNDLNQMKSQNNNK